MLRSGGREGNKGALILAEIWGEGRQQLGVDEGHGPGEAVQGHVWVTPHPPDLRALDLFHQPSTSLFTDSGPTWGRRRWHLMCPLSPVERGPATCPPPVAQALRDASPKLQPKAQLTGPAQLGAPPRATPSATVHLCAQEAVFPRYPPHQADRPHTSRSSPPGSSPGQRLEGDGRGPAGSS